MDWTAIAMIAGFCVGVAGLIFTLRSVPRAKIISGRRLESAGELCGVAILWGGLALGQVGNIAQEMRGGASPQTLAFSMFAGAGMVLVLGISLGRLSVRRQLRLDARTQEEPHDAAVPAGSSAPTFGTRTSSARPY